MTEEDDEPSPSHPHPHPHPPSTYHRHTLAPRGGLTYPPSRLAPPSHVVDAPLTLHIPQSQDLPRIAPPSIPPPFDGQPFDSTTYHVPKSLPSFATFREHTTRSEHVDGPDIASMSSRLPCHLCTTLKPLVKDVAASVAELGEYVQAYCSRSMSRVSDTPNDDPVRTVRWVLDRLRYAKTELQDAFRWTHAGYVHHQAAPNPSVLPRTISPPNPWKRAASQRDDDVHVSKRPRRASIEFGSRVPRPYFSPPPTESLPGSTHPRQASPTFPSRNASRALPSPASFAHPLSAAPSLPTPTVQSVGSPTTSYQPSTSIHTASSSPATSAHIADLQHQVTLKSLALQTLQSEYSSLLQKLQRERVSNQALEKKTNVADQEINDLTGKNEDLMEHVKALEIQLDGSEKKREVERAAAAMEKEQWGRMLEMGGRLQAKVDAERQRLIEEKTLLEQRLASYEDEYAVGPNRVKQDLNRVKQDVGTRVEPTRSHSLGMESRHGKDIPLDSIAAGAATGSNGGRNDVEVVGLRREVVVLSGRVKALRHALEGVSRHNQGLEDKIRGVLEQSNQFGSAIDRALNDDDHPTRTNSPNAEHQPGQIGQSTQLPPARLQPAATELRGPSAPSSQSQAISIHRSLIRPGTFDVVGGKNTVVTANIADVARALTPGPGIEISSSTSSPEELIRAFGSIPAPVPVPPMQLFGMQTSSWLPAMWARPEHASHATGSPIHHVSSSRKDLLDRSRPVGTSPPSYHSSPGEMMEDHSSSSGSANRSPDRYASDPETSRNLDRSSHAPRTLQLKSTDPQDYYSNVRQDWRPAMPPPPKT